MGSDASYPTPFKSLVDSVVHPLSLDGMFRNEASLLVAGALLVPLKVS